MSTTLYYINIFRKFLSFVFRIFPYIGLNGLPNVNLLKLRDVVVEACCECLAAPYAAKSFTDWNEAVSFYGARYCDAILVELLLF